jgi:hypothetical protein
MVISVFICVRLLSIESATAAQTTNWFPYALSFLLGMAKGFFAPIFIERHEARRLEH